MISWSTDTINKRERFSFWREVVCETLYNISPEVPSKSFSARIMAQNYGPLRFAACESSGYEIIRTNQDIAKAPADYYSLYLQLRGQTVLSQCDESIAFHRNDIVIFDGRQPFRAMVSDEGRRAIAMIPRTMVDWRAPWLRQRPFCKLASDSGYADLARRHMMQLTFNDLSENETSLLTDNLCNLLALASAPGITPNRLQPELQIEALLAFCRQNLHDSRLSPQFVSARFGISVRTLHLRFEKLGQTFGRWLLEARLDACSKALRDPHQHARNISDIAYSWGFNDLSHFNKAFRAQFGMPPGQWRYEFAMKQ
jgi:AraC-like DNA-binding protein